MTSANQAASAAGSPDLVTGIAPPHPPDVASQATRPVPGTAPDPAPPHRWTFLTNHAHVLIVLSGQPDLVLREVAQRVGITERAVQRIVQDLEEAGVLTRRRIGRQNRYSVSVDRPLRHPIEAHRTIGDLIALVAVTGAPVRPADTQPPGDQSG